MAAVIFRFGFGRAGGGAPPSRAGVSSPVVSPSFLRFRGAVVAVDVVVVSFIVLVIVVVTVNVS